MHSYSSLLMEKFRTRERATFQFTKVMLTVACGPLGFAVVIAIDNGGKFNRGGPVSKVLTPLSDWWRERGDGDF
jgi:hypothetical protein